MNQAQKKYGKHRNKNLVASEKKRRTTDYQNVNIIQ